MPKLIFRSTEYKDNAYDINKIVRACSAKGYEISANDAEGSVDGVQRINDGRLDVRA
jgi:TRAP-type uncharacterized transport system substrate-binding protein